MLTFFLYRRKRLPTSTLTSSSDTTTPLTSSPLPLSVVVKKPRCSGDATTHVPFQPPPPPPVPRVQVRSTWPVPPSSSSSSSGRHARRRFHVLQAASRAAESRRGPAASAAVAPGDRQEPVGVAPCRRRATGGGGTRQPLTTMTTGCSVASQVCYTTSVWSP